MRFVAFIVCRMLNIRVSPEFQLSSTVLQKHDILGITQNPSISFRQISMLQFKLDCIRKVLNEKEVSLTKSVSDSQTTVSETVTYVPQLNCFTKTQNY